MPAPLALTVLMLLTIPSGHASSHKETGHIAGWTLRVQRDDFAERVTCQLSKPKVSYSREALVFQLSLPSDTSGAVYRIDGGSPALARDDAVELVRLGFALHNDDLDNPSGGLVRIPARRLLDSRVVNIEIKSNHRPATFKIEGLREALAAATKAGCAADDIR